MALTAPYDDPEEYVALSFVTWELQEADWVLVMAAVTSCGDALQHASEALQADFDVAIAAVVNTGVAFEHTSKSLCTDCDIVLAAVSSCDRGPASSTMGTMATTWALSAIPTS